MTKICVAVDIEKPGCKMMRNPIASIGFVVGSGNKILEKQRFNVKINWDSEMNGGDVEQRCYDEFWSKVPRHIIDDCIKDAEEPTVIWPKINDWINSLEIKYPSPEYNICFLTDNASFDIASIDYALEKYCDRMPMRYTTSNKYRAVISADDMLDMVDDNSKNIIYEKIKQDVVSDHNPVNDAHAIYLQYYYAMQYSNKLDMFN